MYHLTIYGDGLMKEIENLAYEGMFLTVTGEYQPEPPDGGYLSNVRVYHAGWDITNIIAEDHRETVIKLAVEEIKKTLARMG